jgi:hypothetical protein
MTFGVLVEPWGSPAVSGFEERIPTVFDEADQQPSFVARSTVGEWIDELPQELQSWGPWAPYRRTVFHDPPDVATDREASTLSVWLNLEAVFRFAYGGPHLEALRRRGEWFEPSRWPTYVAWWVDDDTTPSWVDAATHLEHLHSNGPTAFAFDFHHPFDAEGNAAPRPRLSHGGAP